VQSASLSPKARKHEKSVENFLRSRVDQIGRRVVEQIIAAPIDDLQRMMKKFYWRKHKRSRLEKLYASIHNGGFDEFIILYRRAIGRYVARFTTQDDKRNFTFAQLADATERAARRYDTTTKLAPSDNLTGGGG
jgi:hypothetical protein